jgi:hypothetical protein
MRRTMLIPAVMAIVFAGAAVPAVTQVQQTLTATGDTVDALTTTTQTLLTPTTNTATLTGMLVDASCYTTRGKTASGPGNHEKCAIVCAQRGNRLALVTDKGDVYMVIGVLTQENNAKLVQFVNKTVVITGTVKQVVAQDIIPDTISTVISKLDKRRPQGTEDGVTPPQKKGDARQGDILTAPETAIDATGINLAKVP